jgi:hypothetical protein
MDETKEEELEELFMEVKRRRIYNPFNVEQMKQNIKSGRFDKEHYIRLLSEKIVKHEEEAEQVVAVLKERFSEMEAAVKESGEEVQRMIPMLQQLETNNVRLKNNLDACNAEKEDYRNRINEMRGFVVTAREGAVPAMAIDPVAEETQLAYPAHRAFNQTGMVAGTVEAARLGGGLVKPRRQKDKTRQKRGITRRRKNTRKQTNKTKHKRRKTRRRTKKRRNTKR